MRYAAVKRTWACKETRTLDSYLPGNYGVVRTLEDGWIIGGEDDHGWTLDAYVLPRLASGCIVAQELTEAEAVEWVP